MIPEKTIQEAVRRLVEAAQPRRIILFGSHARGEAGPDSDLDFLVVEDEVPDWGAEMVRLRDVLRPLGVPVDVLVLSQQSLEDWGHLPGNGAVYWALKEGRVMYDAA